MRAPAIETIALLERRPDDDVPPDAMREVGTGALVDCARSRRAAS